ncbi:MAG: flippase-like domain-containing protein [Thermomicrobiales bacterium]|nr:flippase-like domain-containing protein [Thermomicrobiales bacterium]
MNQSSADNAKGGLRKLLNIPTPLIFAICIVAATLLLWWQGALAELWEVVREANTTQLLIATPIYVASLWLLAVRWHQLVQMAQGWSDLPRAAEAFLTSIVINYAAPVGLAVPSRAALTKRALGLDGHATGVVALWEIGMDVIVLGFGTLVWLIMAQGSTSAVASELEDNASRYQSVALLLVAVVLVLLIFFFRKAEQRRRAINFIRRILVSPLQRPREAALALASTTIYWIVQGVVLALLVNAMGVDTTFELILGLTTLPMLVGMLSPIPGGAVVREAMMYVVARLAGVPGAEVVAAAVIYRMALFLAIPILYGITRIWLTKRDGGHPHPESVEESIP